MSPHTARQGAALCRRSGRADRAMWDRSNARLQPASAAARFSRIRPPARSSRQWSAPFVRLEPFRAPDTARRSRSEEHTSELQSQSNLVCRLLLEKKKKTRKKSTRYIKKTKNQ